MQFDWRTLINFQIYHCVNDSRVVIDKVCDKVPIWQYRKINKRFALETTQVYIELHVENGENIYFSGTTEPFMK